MSRKKEKKIYSQNYVEKERRKSKNYDNKNIVDRTIKNRNCNFVAMPSDF